MSENILHEVQKKKKKKQICTKQKLDKSRSGIKTAMIGVPAVWQLCKCTTVESRHNEVRFNEIFTTTKFFSFPVDVP